MSFKYLDVSSFTPRLKQCSSYKILLLIRIHFFMYHVFPFSSYNRANKKIFIIIRVNSSLPTFHYIFISYPTFQNFELFDIVYCFLALEFDEVSTLSLY